MTDNKENLKLWDSVGKTDPAYTRSYKGAGGFSGTAVNPLYTVKRLTEMFGALGVGWGYEVLEDRFDCGSTEYDKETKESIGINSIHTIKIELWHMEGDKKASATHYGHTPFVYRNKWGMQTDSEFAKKSLTDALNKAASMFGFNSDIYLGKFDDINYVQEVGDEFAIQEADDKDAELIRQRQEYEALLADNLDLIKTSVAINELEVIYKSIIRKAKRRDDKAGIKQLNDAVKLRKSELEGDKK